MVAQKGTGQQSMNSGEFAPDLAGRVDIKQYYSAGLQFRNVEPIEQGGFRNLPGTRRIGLVGSTQAPHFWRMKRSRTESFFVAVKPQALDIFKAGALAASVSVPALTPAISAEASLYLEADTIGIFHRDLQSLRVLRQSDANWSLSFWPFQKIPDVDYGGVYTKVDDVWLIHIRSADATPEISFTVDGETTPAIGYISSSPANLIAFANTVKSELEQLPSLGPGIVVEPHYGSAAYSFIYISFTGALSGREYDLNSVVANTTAASALAVHFRIGRTDGEPAFSASRGWPAVVSVVQDRMVYGAFRSRPSALLFSQTGEYFTVNIKAIRDDGAKLEAIRTNSKEEILHIKDSKYLLVFTDQAEYFATNRVVKRGEPLNFIQTTSNGLAPGTWPVEIDNRIYYVGQRRKVLFSTAYDDLASAFTARMESLLAPHLIDGIVMTDLQRGTDDANASRLWLLRSDGLLVGASLIRDQEITAFFRLDVGAPIRSIGVDSRNVLWLVVERAGGLTYEVLDDATFLLGSVDRTTDSAGLATGLPFPNGASVWAETADGFTLGPFTVAAGSIDTGWPAMALRLGEWLAPIWESMPRVLVTGDDKIVRRPGRVHTVKANVIDTTSIAIGANGVTPKTVALLKTSDPTDTPMPGKTQLVVVDGIPGFKLDTTAIITQTKPGRLRVRDVTLEEKL